MQDGKTAGELANKALADTTKYKADEVGHALSDDIIQQLDLAIANYYDKIEENEFCVVMVIASDPLIPNMKRRKYYCWPWLPAPRPNQTVFLYNKAKGRITKRLWVLPPAKTMAALASSDLIPVKKYETMRDWSVAFFKGTFWEFIRYQHNIKMLSQEEYFKLHEAELVKAKLNEPDLFTPQPFDFGKISCGEVFNTENIVSK